MKTAFHQASVDLNKITFFHGLNKILDLMAMAMDLHRRFGEKCGSDGGTIVTVAWASDGGLACGYEDLRGYLYYHQQYHDIFTT